MTNPLAQDLDHILTHTQGLWEEFRGQQLFITGGTGFFGCWLLESFTWACDRLDLGASATVLTRNPEAFARKAPWLASHRSVRLHRGDVRNFEFPEGEFSHVIHAAAESSTDLNQRAPLEMLDAIVAGTRRTLDFAVARGAQKFLFVSSGAVYGEQPADVTHVPETYPGSPDPLDPTSAYAEAKRTAELLCAIYYRQYALAATIARCWAFVGPYLPLDRHFAIGNFIREAIEGRPILVKGDGRARRSYLYAADLAAWLWTMLAAGRPCRAYNVGAEAPVSIAELAALVLRALGATAGVEIGGQAQKGGRLQYVPATARARSELNLSETVPLEEAVRRTARWASIRTGADVPV